MRSTALPAALDQLPRPARPLRRLGAGIFLFAMALFGFGLWITAVETKAGQIQDPSVETSFEDYITFYSAGRMVLDGRGRELYDLDATRDLQTDVIGRPVNAPDDADVLPFFNPPFFAALMVPFAILPFDVSAGVWFALICILIAVAGVFLSRFLGFTKFRDRAAVIAWFVTWPSVVLVAVQGQLSILPLLAWLGFIAFQVQGKQSASGACLALALIKPQFVVLLVPVLIWQRQWQALRSFAMIGTPLAIVSVIIAGPHVLFDYPRFVLQSASWDHENGIVPESMFGWSGFLARTIGLDGMLHRVVSSAAVLGTIGAVVFTMRRGWRSDEADFPARMAIVLGASMLISLHLYRQDLSLVTLLVACGAYHSHRITGSWGFWPAVAGLFWAIQYVELNFLFERGINVLTLTIAASIVALVWQTARQTKERRLAEPATPDAISYAA